MAVYQHLISKLNKGKVKYRDLLISQDKKLKDNQVLRSQCLGHYQE